MTSIEHISDELRALGVRRGAVLLVHTSFRAVRPVDGGPTGLIEALGRAIGEGGTLVMPTMTDGESILDPHTTPTVGMGITAETFWRLPGVIRSTHPGGSFAARGPSAAAVCAPQPLEPPHGEVSPPGRVHALGGQVLLLGVTQSESTTLHVAEAIAKVPYAIGYPCVVERDGKPESVIVHETDHCCRGFRKMDGWLRERGLLREGTVGQAPSTLAESRDVVRVAVERLRENPLTFLCARGSGCEECDAAHASVPAKLGERSRP